MERLKCGDRAIRCLSGMDIDHVPYGIGFGWHPWDKTLERWRAESGIPDLDPADYLGFEKSFLNPDIDSGMRPSFERLVLEETPDYIIVRDERGITTKIDYDCDMHQWLEYPVKTPDDWYRLRDERWRIDDSGRTTQDWDAFRERLDTSGEVVQVGCYPWGVFGSVRDLLGDEEALISFITEPEMIRDMMEHLTSLWVSMWERVVAEVRIDHIHIWEDMSGRQGSLISPAMVEDFMMPCYDRVVRFADEHGVSLISVDTDGYCAELIPIMMKHGINVFMPFEVQAGNDIFEYRREYPKLGIIGGLDKRALALGKKEIDAELEKAARMIEKGRYIPSFDHHIPPDVPWENFRYATEEMRIICGL